MHTLKPALAVLTGVLVLASALHANDADARERSGSGAWRNSHGGSGSYQHHTVRERGSLARDTSWQRAHGRSGSATLERSRDRATGTGSSSRSVTRANGDAATWNTTGQRTDSGAVVHGEGTNFRGQDVSMDRTLTQNDDGSRSVETTRVNEITGKRIATDKTVTPTENGWTSSGRYATGSGKTGTTQGSLTRTDDGFTRAGSATNSEGQTASRTVDVTHADGSTTRSVSTTGFNGETHTHSTTVTPVP